MVDRVLSELADQRGRVILVIDDLHELNSPEALAQLTRLLTNLPPNVHAILATQGDTVKAGQPIVELDQIVPKEAAFEIRRDIPRLDILDEEDAQPFVPKAHDHTAAPSVRICTALWYRMQAFRRQAGKAYNPNPKPAAERPVHIAARHRDAGDVAADMLFEGGAPGHEAESEPVVDHREPAAG